MLGAMEKKEAGVEVGRVQGIDFKQGVKRKPH